MNSGERESHKRESERSMKRERKKRAASPFSGHGLAQPGHGRGQGARGWRCRLQPWVAGVGLVKAKRRRVKKEMVV